MQRHKGHHGGRYDDPHGVTAPSTTRVNQYSAATRKATPPSKGEVQQATAEGKILNTAAGSKASSDVMNSGGQAPGEGMSMVRQKYRDARKSGMSPDTARGIALHQGSYPALSGPGGSQGPKITRATDYEGKSVR